MTAAWTMVVCTPFWFSCCGVRRRWFAYLCRAFSSSRVRSPSSRGPLHCRLLGSHEERVLLLPVEVGLLQ